MIDFDNNKWYNKPLFSWISFFVFYSLFWYLTIDNWLDEEFFKAILSGFFVVLMTSIFLFGDKVKQFYAENI